MYHFLNKIIECFTNWLNIGLPGFILGKLTSDYNKLLEFVFNIDIQNMETYSNCICLLLRLPLKSNQMNDVSSLILNRIIAFEQRYILINTEYIKQ